MPFGSARSVHTRADMPHCMSFSNKACFHGDHLSPYCATFYGGRARNASAVTYPIFKSPGFGWIWMNLIYFFTVHSVHAHYMNNIMYNKKCTCIHWGQGVAAMLFDKDENWLQRFTSTAARPLPGIQLHTTVIFFLSICRRFFFSPSHIFLK